MGRLKGVGSRRHLTSGDACRSKSQKEVFYQSQVPCSSRSSVLKQKTGGGGVIQANAVDRFREDILLVRERVHEKSECLLGDFQGCREV